jgi:hypothetical protein
VLLALLLACTSDPAAVSESPTREEATATVITGDGPATLVVTSRGEGEIEPCG